MTTTEMAIRNGAADAWETKIDVIRRNYAPDATDAEFELYLYKCRRYGLEPGTQIHFTKRGGRMTIITAIDGYRLLAERTGKYAGSDDAVFTESHPVTGAPSPWHPEAATVTVWKLVGGQRCPFTATARWIEYVPDERQQFMWKKMPHTMLAKCAEALALRKAFPAELSGLYTDTEMEQADSEPSTPRPAPTPHLQAPQRTHEEPERPTPTYADVFENAAEQIPAPPKPAKPEAPTELACVECGEVHATVRHDDTVYPLKDWVAELRKAGAKKFLCADCFDEWSLGQEAV